MLSKEECIKALENTRYLNVSIVNETGADIWNGEFEQTKEFDVFEQLIKEHFNPQPYKFEDLKVGMWVWDKQLEWCFEIAICKVETKIKGLEDLKMFKVKNYDGSSTLMIFEENRFFPVWMANM